MSHARTANLPGAIALGLADNILDTAKGHLAHGGCTPAALSVIGHEPGQSIDFLAPRAKAMKKFGVAYQVDNNTITNYKRRFYVYLESSSGETHHILAVPAVFIVDHGGNIAFVRADSDYKVRMKGAKVLAAARAASSFEALRK